MLCAESESKDAAHEEAAEEKPKEDLSKAAPLLKCAPQPSRVCRSTLW